MLRLIVLLPVAFIAGWIYASQSAADRCEDLSGVMRDRVCRGVP